MEENINSTENTSEEKDAKSTNILAPLFDLLKEITKEADLKEIIESVNEVKKENIKADIAISKINQTVWKWKYLKEFLIILIILIAVLFLSYYDKIEASTTGTLLGSIIGYAIGNFNSKEKQN